MKNTILPGNEDFLQFVDAYGTGRDDSKIVDIIMKIYNAARSCPWEDEWYEECLENYLVTEKSMDSNPCIQYLFNDLKKSLEDFDGIFDKLEKICQSPDGPARLSCDSKRRPSAYKDAYQF